jgi:ferritin-like metal-binding protein YciE
MGIFSKDIKSMDDLFVHTLRDIYYAEKQILKSLPDMIEKSSDPQLKQGFQAHQSETRNQVTRLEQVFRLHGQEPKGIDCPAIDGIIEEAEDVVGEVDDKSVLDAALIAAAQTVEHYEITRYEPDRMGEGTRTQRLRGAPSTESGRGKSHRQETDFDCREQGQPHGGVAAGNCPPHPRNGADRRLCAFGPRNRPSLPLGSDDGRQQTRRPRSSA